ncbi:MAG: response regulator [Candidatus Rokubacteria bacterium]|nr:response regulator [Candidatus Rokubacteria bacterium]
MPAARKQILIVEDNEVVIEVLRDFLSEGYDVDAVQNAEAALETIQATAPDAILMDVRMPGTDGLTLLASLRKLGFTAPIFVMTGYDSPETAERAKRSGATGYLVKPVDLRKLDALIGGALKTPPLLGR